MARRNTKTGGGEARGASQRQLRVGEMIRHALADMLARGDIHDETLAAHVVSIPEVRLSTDLRMASIYVMPLGGNDTADVIAALDRHKRYIRSEVAHVINLKYAPEIRFLADDSFDEASRIDQLLDKVRRDVAAADATDKTDQTEE